MTNKNGQKERLKDFIKYLGIPTKTFEESCGLSNGYVSSIRKGIGYRAIEQITECYPNLNPIWLMVGEGKMLLTEENETLKEQEPSPTGILEELRKNYIEKEERLLRLIESQQEVIKNQSEALKKGNARKGDNATCADAVG